MGKAVKYYGELIKLKTVNVKYYKHSFRFLFRCMLIKVFGDKIIDIMRKRKRK